MPSIGPKRFLLDVDDDNEFRFQSFMIHVMIHSPLDATQCACFCFAFGEREQ